MNVNFDVVRKMSEEFEFDDLEMLSLMKMIVSKVRS